MIIKIINKLFVFTALSLSGANLIDKWRVLSIFDGKVSYGDLLFAFYLIVVLFKALKVKSISWLIVSSRHKKFVYSLLGLAFCVGLSWCINTILRGGQLIDFFGGPVRLLFYCVISLVVARWVRIYGPNLIAISFSSGILIMFYSNLVNLISEKNLLTISGTVWENTMSAVVLAASGMILGLSEIAKPNFVNILLMCTSYASITLVYSLAGLFYILFGLPVIFCGLFRYFGNRELKKSQRYLSLMILFTLIYAIVTNFSFAFEGIALNINRKLENAPFTRQNYDKIGSFEARSGHVLSSVVIAISNPIFGVGEYNWQSANRENMYLTGAAFHDNENPHNAFAYVISTCGIPAFSLFVYCVAIVFQQLNSLYLLDKRMWKLFVISTVLVFLEGGNIAVGMFSTLYFFIYGSLAFGIEKWNKKVIYLKEKK